ncbi:MAG: hypothetical protein F4Z22_10855 [Acidimicrobiia bacterium]|nr:hypothetical protein [Acidimicrobiia bacterium]
MTPTETQRHELRTALGDVLAEAQVRTLMESLPPMGWQELATKSDLAALEERVGVRLDVLRTDLGAKIDSGVAALNAAVMVLNAKIDTGLAVLNAKIDTELTDLNAKIDTGLAEVRGELADVRGELKLGLAKQTYIVLAGVAAVLAAAMTPVYIALFAAFGG